MPDDHGDAKDDREHDEGRGVIVGGVPGGLVGAGIVEIDILLQDIVSLDPELVDGLGIQFVGVVRQLAGGLARQRHDFLACPSCRPPRSWTQSA